MSQYDSQNAMHDLDRALFGGVANGSNGSTSTSLKSMYTPRQESVPRYAEVRPVAEVEKIETRYVTEVRTVAAPPVVESYVSQSPRKEVVSARTSYKLIDSNSAASIAAAIVEAEQFNRAELIEFQTLSYCVIEGFQETLFNVTYDRLMKLQRIIEQELWTIVESSYKEIRKWQKDSSIQRKGITVQDIIEELQLMNSCRIMEYEIRLAEAAVDEAVVQDLNAMMKVINREVREHDRVRKAVVYLGREFREALGQLISVSAQRESKKSKASSGEVVAYGRADLYQKKQDEIMNLAQWEGTRNQSLLQDNIAQAECAIEKIIEIRMALLMIIKQRIAALKTEYNTDYGFSYDEEDQAHAYKKMEAIVQVSKSKWASENEVLRAEFASLEAAINAREEQRSLMVEEMRMEEIKITEELNTNAQKQAQVWDKITELMFQMTQLASQRSYYFNKYLKYRRNFEIRVADNENWLIQARVYLKELEDFIANRSCHVDVIEKQVQEHKKVAFNQRTTEEKLELLMAERRDYVKYFTDYYFQLHESLVKYSERIDELDIMIEQNEFHIGNARKFMDENATKYRKQIEQWSDLRQELSMKRENLRFAIISARSEFEVMAAELSENGILTNDPIADAEAKYGHLRQKMMQKRMRFQEQQASTTADEMTNITTSPRQTQKMTITASSTSVRVQSSSGLVSGSSGGGFNSTSNGSVRSISPTATGSYKRAANNRL